MTIINEINEFNLLESVAETGVFLVKGLEGIVEAHPNLVHSARGVGCFAALDFHDAGIRDQIVPIVSFLL